MKQDQQCPVEPTEIYVEILKHAAEQKVQLKATFVLRPSLKDRSADGAKHTIRNIMMVLHNTRCICIPKSDDVILYKRVEGNALGQEIHIRFMVLKTDFCPSPEWELLNYFLTDLHVDNQI